MISAAVPDYTVPQFFSGYWPERWNKALAAEETPMEGVVVLEDQDTVVGVAWMGPYKNRGVGVCDRALLRRLFVDPAQQGKGYGSILLNWAIEKARLAGARQLELWCLDLNQAAIDFYMRRGFHKEGVLGEFKGDGRKLVKRRYRFRFYEVWETPPNTSPILA